MAAAIAWPVCAQQWEAGVSSGYGWNHNTSVVNGAQTAQGGVHSGAVAGAVLGEDLYNYVGGEVRYFFQWGAPELGYQGARASISGYSNVVTYEMLFHMRPRESRLRPFAAGGAGIKVYTGRNRPYGAQPLTQFAVLAPCTQVEPAISAGGGLKYLASRHVLVRADFRVYMTPLPDEIFRTVRASYIRGWVFNFVPQVGISYVF